MRKERILQPNDEQVSDGRAFVEKMETIKHCYPVGIKYREIKHTVIISVSIAAGTYLVGKLIERLIPKKDAKTTKEKND